MSLTVPKHPIPMTTLFRDCFLVNFAVEPSVIRSLLPPPLEPDLHRGSAFLSVVIADMWKMRPAFLPRPFGVTYTQVVYRAVVVCRGERGVYFLRSDADNRLMCLLGNLMTFFHFSLARMDRGRTGPYRRFDLSAVPAHRADIHALFDLSEPSRGLPPTSRFASLGQAQEFLVELYAAFAADACGVNTVRIRRGEWAIAVVEDLKHVYQFMQGGGAFPAGSAELDSVFHVSDLPYHWSRLERRPHAPSEGETTPATGPG